MAREIERAIEESPVARNAAWGIQAAALPSGKTLFEINAGHFFVPASNTKLFSTSLALTRLGPDFTFETRVVTRGRQPDASRRYGWRSASGRRRGSQSFRPHDSLSNGFAARAMGLLRCPISPRKSQPKASRASPADIVGDDTLVRVGTFWRRMGNRRPGLRLRRARLGAQLERQRVHPARSAPAQPRRDLASITLNPPVAYYTIHNHIRTTAAGERHIHYSRAPGGMTLELWGTIPLAKG